MIQPFLTRLAILTYVVLLGPPNVAQDLDGVGLPLLVTTPTPPVPVRADGVVRLVYELHLTNAGSKPVTLNRVEVWSSAKLATMEGDDLAKAIKPTGLNTQEPRTIGSGAHAVLMMWVSVDRTPDTITHRLEGVEGGSQHDLVLQSPEVPVRGTAVRLTPPLRGDRWLAANGPSNDTHHRRSWLAHGGRALFPERFAIDFLRLHEDGPTNGDPAENESWRGYGAEVLAVAEARVASIKDGIPDNVPANRFPPGMTLDTMAATWWSSISGMVCTRSTHTCSPDRFVSGRAIVFARARCWALWGIRTQTRRTSTFR